MSEITEADVLEALLPWLEEEGYTVYLHPTRLLVPPFLQNDRPDAIALRADKNLAIEIALRQTDENRERLQRMPRALEGQDKWELRVYWGSPTALQRPLEIQTPEAIKARVAELRDLSDKGYLEPALLLGWATFEALARATMAPEFERPQAPGRRDFGSRRSHHPDRGRSPPTALRQAQQAHSRRASGACVEGRSARVRASPGHSAGAA